MIYNLNVMISYCNFLCNPINTSLFLALGMIGYGMAKAAIHQLTYSLAQSNSGLPAGAVVATILP